MISVADIVLDFLRTHGLVGNAPRQADSLSELALLALLGNVARVRRRKKGGRACARAELTRLRNLSREMRERQEPRTASPPTPTSQNPANNETILGTDGIPSIDRGHLAPDVALVSIIPSIVPRETRPAPPPRHLR